MWRLYVEAFDELRTAAVARHVVLRPEFDDMMADPQVVKLLGLDGDRLCALSTLTNDLTSVPWISPEYFQHHWPEDFAAGRIWYVGLIGVHPEFRNSGLFEALVEATYRRAAGGMSIMVAFDVCRRNDQYGFATAVRTTLEGLSIPVRPHRLDEQTYWLYELPTAA